MLADAAFKFTIYPLPILAFLGTVLVGYLILRCMPLLNFPVRIIQRWLAKRSAARKAEGEDELARIAVFIRAQLDARDRKFERSIAELLASVTKTMDNFAGQIAAEQQEEQSRQDALMKSFQTAYYLTDVGCKNCGKYFTAAIRKGVLIDDPNLPHLIICTNCKTNVKGFHLSGHYYNLENKSFPIPVDWTPDKDDKRLIGHKVFSHELFSGVDLSDPSNW